MSAEMEEYTEHKLMQDDCLKLLKFLASDFFRFKIVKVLLWLHILVHGTVSVLSIYYFLNVMDRKEFIYYAPAFLTTIYMINTQLIILHKNDLVAKIKEEITLWSIDSVGERNYKKIKFEISIINVVLIVLILLGLVDLLLFLQHLEKDKEFFLVIPILEHFFPNQKNALWLIYKATYPLCGYSMTVQPLQLIYYTQHVRFQVRLFIEKITSDAENVNVKIREEEIYYDEESQNQIRKKLIFQIRRFQDIVKLHYEKNKEIYHIIAIYSIFATIFGLGIIIFILSGKFYEEYLPRIGLGSVIVGIVFVATLASAQSTEDQSEMIEENISYWNTTGWYNYKSSNKKLFLILLINLSRPRRIKISENYTVNYKFGLAIVRGIYSVITVIINMAK